MRIIRLVVVAALFRVCSPAEEADASFAPFAATGLSGRQLAITR